MISECSTDLAMATMLVQLTFGSKSQVHYTRKYSLPGTVQTPSLESGMLAFH